MNRIGLLLCLAVIGVVAVTGCGGGGKSGGSSPSYDRLVVPRILNTAGAIQGAATALHGAAEAVPVPGSVNQSSDVDNDGFQVMVSGPAKTLTIEVYNTDPTDDGRDAPRYDRERPTVTEPVDPPLKPGGYGVVRAASGKGLARRRVLPASGGRRPHIGFPAGQLWVDLYTDYEGEDDTDYLAGGIWVFVPETATAVDEYEFGAFVDGNDPFSEDPTALTGTAKYEGDATGVYSVQEDSLNFFFDALVELTADFDNNDIEGRIHTFTVDGEPVEVDRTLLLQTATFDEREQRVFHRRHTGEVGRRNLRGQVGRSVLRQRRGRWQTGLRRRDLRRYNRRSRYRHRRRKEYSGRLRRAQADGIADRNVTNP